MHAQVSSSGNSFPDVSGRLQDPSRVATFHLTQPRKDYLLGPLSSTFGVFASVTLPQAHTPDPKHHPPSRRFSGGRMGDRRMCASHGWREDPERSHGSTYGPTSTAPALVLGPGGPHSCVHRGLLLRWLPWTFSKAATCPYSVLLCLAPPSFQLPRLSHFRCPPPPPSSVLTPTPDLSLQWLSSSPRHFLREQPLIHHPPPVSLKTHPTPGVRATA